MHEHSSIRKSWHHRPVYNFRLIIPIVHRHRRRDKAEEMVSMRMREQDHVDRTWQNTSTVHTGKQMATAWKIREIKPDASVNHDTDTENVDDDDIAGERRRVGGGAVAMYDAAENSVGHSEYVLPARVIRPVGNDGAVEIGR